ncbi:hypothetical protein K469DRAFT_651358 [Zopfia rhizophila CBS 207.26]|uniref:AB hydrolase-1 domain-containing protein n=1 Tax=Zopfia rhizophila CBS 207.26 TaxID=1314779 RepID=A0A6A6ET51_9PEZI|nr:hypothetical protein K469DRAFT_651358 [Zopfia rhizophila CBS 207.26]
MIGISTPEYVFIRASIISIRAIAPLSILYCGFCIIHPPHSIFSKVVLAWAAIESAFYFLLYLPRKRFLQRPARHPELLSYEDRQELFQRACKTIPNPEYYLSKWFLGAPLEEIKRENVKDFFRWAFLNTGDFDISDNEELEGYTDGVERLLGRKIEPGRGKAKCLRLTVDEVGMMHRPFVWYMIVGVVDTLTAAYLRYNSFTLYRTPMRHWLGVFPFRNCSLFTRRISPAPNISYWYRPHTSKTRLPILFIHGISIGLYSYAQFLAEITKEDALEADDGQTGIIALEIMPISFRLTQPTLDKAETCRQINAILKAHGWNKVVLATHSYGSVISTHLLQTPSTAPKLGPILLIDPVTFLLHLPDVAYNFTARKPRQANEHQLYYFASKDMMVAHTLSRHFFWSQNILWKEDIKSRDVTVSLGGRDLIVDTETVGRYLAGVDLKYEGVSWKGADWVGQGLDVLWFPTCDHAQAFERKAERKRLVDVVRAYSRGRDVEDLP